MVATMIIFHAPDVLEFASNGCSLGKHKTPDAEDCFRHIALMDAVTRPLVIDKLFNLFEQNPLQLIERKERTHPL